jgi:carbon storage regulator CsrA
MDAKQGRQGGLVLTRKLGESIMVDGPVEIRVTRISGGRVRLQCFAHPSTIILRGEILKGKPKNA